MALRCFCAILLSITGAFSLANDAAGPTPASIESAVKHRGPKVVLKEFANNWNEWTMVTRGIATGSKDWLHIYKLLKPDSDAALAETLDISLSKALSTQPETVLLFILQEPHADVAFVCGRLDDDAEKTEYIPFLKKQRSAVASVKLERLNSLKSKCLAVINESIQYQIKNK